MGCPWTLPFGTENQPLVFAREITATQLNHTHNFMAGESGGCRCGYAAGLHRMRWAAGRMRCGFRLIQSTLSAVLHRISNAVRAWPVPTEHSPRLLAPSTAPLAWFGAYIIANSSNSSTVPTRNEEHRKTQSPPFKTAFALLDPIASLAHQMTCGDQPKSLRAVCSFVFPFSFLPAGAAH